MQFVSGRPSRYESANVGMLKAMNLRTVAKFVRHNTPARWFVSVGEIGVFGSRIRESIALTLLNGYYSSLWRRHWIWQTRGEPHFTLHRVGLFQSMIGSDAAGFCSYARAFHSASAVRPGDIVLDVGCGDGSFTRRALAPDAAHVDGIDIEPTAIAYASRHNSLPNISFAVVDALKESMPTNGYDLIAFDGAIAHFSAGACSELLKKLKSAMKPDGLFVGSESVGPDAPDHLQVFDTLDDLRTMLAKHWKYVRLTQQSYKIPFAEKRRVEGYWRCSDSLDRLDALSWR